MQSIPVDLPKGYLLVCVTKSQRGLNVCMHLYYFAFWTRLSLAVSGRRVLACVNTAAGRCRRGRASLILSFQHGVVNISAAPGRNRCRDIYPAVQDLIKLVSPGSLLRSDVEHDERVKSNESIAAQHS